MNSLIDNVQYRLMLLFALVGILGMGIGIVFTIYVTGMTGEYMYNEFYDILLLIGVLAIAASVFAIAVKRRK